MPAYRSKADAEPKFAERLHLTRSGHLAIAEHNFCNRPEAVMRSSGR